jgi:hypothetical protein
MDRWVIGYPYGAYDERLLEVLRRNGCRAGFTTEVRTADLNSDDRLTIPRLDTNDLPKRGDAEAAAWISNY